MHVACAPCGAGCLSTASHRPVTRLARADEDTLFQVWFWLRTRHLERCRSWIAFSFGRLQRFVKHARNHLREENLSLFSYEMRPLWGSIGRSGPLQGSVCCSRESAFRLHKFALLRGAFPLLSIESRLSLNVVMKTTMKRLRVAPSGHDNGRFSGRRGLI